MDLDPLIQGVLERAKFRELIMHSEEAIPMIWRSLVGYSQVERMTAMDLLSADTENSSLRETLVVEALLPLPRRIFWIRNSESVSYYNQQIHPPPRNSPHNPCRT